MPFPAKAVAFALPILACGAARAADPTPPAAAAAPAVSANLRVYRDPQTGKLVSQPVTAEQRAQTLDVPHIDESKVRVIDRGNGMKQAELNGQYQSTYSARRRADGTLEFYCNEDEGVKPAEESRNDR